MALQNKTVLGAFKDKLLASIKVGSGKQAYWQGQTVHHLQKAGIARWPAGTAGGHGGEFAPKGTSGEGVSPPVGHGVKQPAFGGSEKHKDKITKKLNAIDAAFHKALATGDGSHLAAAHPGNKYGFLVDYHNKVSDKAAFHLAKKALAANDPAKAEVTLPAKTQIEHKPTPTAPKQTITSTLPKPPIIGGSDAHKTKWNDKIAAIHKAAASGDPALIEKALKGVAKQKSVLEYGQKVVQAHKDAKLGNAVTSEGVKPAHSVKNPDEEQAAHDAANAAYKQKMIEALTSKMKEQAPPLAPQTAAPSASGKPPVYGAGYEHLPSHDKTKVGYIEQALKAHAEYLAGNTIGGVNKQDTLKTLSDLTPITLYGGGVKAYHKTATDWVSGASMEAPKPMAPKAGAEPVGLTKPDLSFASQYEQDVADGIQNLLHQHAVGTMDAALAYKAISSFDLKPGIHAQTLHAYKEKALDHLVTKQVAPAPAPAGMPAKPTGTHLTSLDKLHIEDLHDFVSDLEGNGYTAEKALDQLQNQQFDSSVHSDVHHYKDKLVEHLKQKVAEEQLQAANASFLGGEGGMSKPKGPAFQPTTLDSPVGFSPLKPTSSAWKASNQASANDIQAALGNYNVNKDVHALGVALSGVYIKDKPPVALAKYKHAADTFYQKQAEALLTKAGLPIKPDNGGYYGSSMQKHLVAYAQGHVSKAHAEQKIADHKPYTDEEKKYQTDALAALAGKPENPSPKTVAAPKPAAKPYHAPSSFTYGSGNKPAAPEGGFVGKGADGKWLALKPDGPQLGSNPGGQFKDGVGTKYYAKFQKSEAHADNETLASALYKLTGAKTTDVTKLSQTDKPTTVTPWMEGKAFDPHNPEHVKAVNSDFGTHVWLGNWDAVGLSFDNQKIGPDGKAMTVDVGGSMFFRAQGGEKEFGSHPKELESLKDPSTAPQASAVFGKLGTPLTPEQVESLKKVAQLSDYEIESTVNDKLAGAGIATHDAAKIIDTLKSRRDAIAKVYAEHAAKLEPAKPAATAKQEAPIPALPAHPAGVDFPPALKQHMANMDALHQKGDVEGLKGYLAPDLQNYKTTNQAAYYGFKQHANNLKMSLAEWHSKNMNGAEQFDFAPIGHITNTVHNDVPNVAQTETKSWHTKVGDYMVIGSAGTTPSKEFLKKNWRNVFVGEAHDHLAKDMMLSLHKSFGLANAAPGGFSELMASYKGNGYEGMNIAARTGDWTSNPGKRFRRLAKFFYTHGHELPGGIILHRGLNMAEGINAVFKQHVGSVLQEPSAASTSWGSQAAFSGKNTQLHIHVMAGVKALPPNTSGSGDSENEVILAPGTKYLVVHSEKRKDGKTHVDLVAYPGEYPV